MDDLFARSLLVVTGKGGVGKSTVAAALGLAAVRRGLGTIVVEVARQDDVTPLLPSSSAARAGEESLIGEGLHHLSIDPQRALEEYLRQQIGVRAVAGLLARSRMFATLTAATPGMSELLAIGKVWDLTRPRRRARGERRYDLAILDAPATGHALAMLRAPSTFAALARAGPIAQQARDLVTFLGDPRRTAAVLVCLAEEMPVNETLDLRAGLTQAPGVLVARVVVNGVLRHRFSGRDERTLRAAPPSPARHAALYAAGWARRQRAQIARLRRGLGGMPITTLPMILDSALDANVLERFSRDLER